MSRSGSAIGLKADRHRHLEDEGGARPKYYSINALRLLLLLGCGVWAIAIAKLFELLGY
jgi:hypothetical protein